MEGQNPSDVIVRNLGRELLDIGCTFSIYNKLGQIVEDPSIRLGMVVSCLCH